MSAWADVRGSQVIGGDGGRCVYGPWTSMESLTPAQALLQTAQASFQTAPAKLATLAWAVYLLNSTHVIVLGYMRM